ncbi:class I SAM-dependent methyltransferase [Amycolatopsis anabasis]|uniref:class I SAM-dependent methyltransferase n=1 Tax=Amycolatopsis anabasis TaxID=1840409 RepID=UPI00131E31BA|nr:methyltransferase domain-containing protein [Amycolatopsis anabasis]
MTTHTPAYRTFLSAAARNPGLVGAVAPSSPALAAELASVVPTTGAPVVVELGAGTGSVTEAIQRRLPAAGRHLAVEIDARLVSYLRARHPGVEVIHDDAEALVRLLAERGVSEVDAVVSGLPWSLFGPAQQRRLLTAIQSVLARHGAFTTFGYLHAAPLAGARRFSALLTESFDEVLVGRTVWRNLPPARSFACRRSVAPDA